MRVLCIIYNYMDLFKGLYTADAFRIRNFRIYDTYV